MVFRVYVEKKPGFDVEAQQLAGELRTILGLTGLRALRIVNRYDVEGISQELFDQTVPTVFSEPQVDNVAYDLPDFAGAKVFATEFLPGQFDQRADSAAECIQFHLPRERDRPLRQAVRAGRRPDRRRRGDHQALRDQPGRGPRGQPGDQGNPEDPCAGARQGRDHRRFQRDGRRSRPEVHRRAVGAAIWPTSNSAAVSARRAASPPSPKSR